MRKLVVVWSCLASTVALSQGLQLNRYEPTPAGEGFTAVQAPWYRQDRLLAVGLGLDYGRDVVVGGTYDAQRNFRPTVGVISGQLSGHLDVAVSPFDSWLFSASLPVNLLEQGTPAFGVTPIGAPAIGDPRLGVDYRLLGDLARDPISVHLGGRLWIPVGANLSHAGDVGFRGEVHAIAGGRPLEKLEWAVNAGVYLRGNASLNQFADGVGAAGSELKLAGGAAYVNDPQRYRVGGEVLFGAGLPGTQNFRPASNHLELLISGAYTFADTIQVGPAIGFSPLRSDGTPSVRGILRIAYAPVGGGKKAAPVEKREPEQVVAASEPSSAIEQTPTEPPAAEPEPTAVAEAEPAQPEPSPRPTFEKPARPGFAFDPAGTSLPPDCTEAPAFPAGTRLVVTVFDFDRSDLSAGDRAELGRLATALKSAPEVRVAVTGFTDETGTEAYNLGLSRRRAEAVKAALQAEGIASRRIQTSGRGGASPRCPEPTEAHRSQNRRAEVELLTR